VNVNRRSQPVRRNQAESREGDDPCSILHIPPQSLVVPSVLYRWGEYSAAAKLRATQRSLKPTKVLPLAYSVCVSIRTRTFNILPLKKSVRI
jgi:hypothetical protein